MFALVDCNNFYASCERVFKPKLRDKPIVVLSNNDGCVIARSNESKAIGVPMGAVAYKYQPMFKKNNIKVFSSNYALYGDMSNRVMQILATFSPDIEIYSVDEAFLYFKGFENLNLKEYGHDIKQKVEQLTGIPISIGFAPTKALSKVANRIAKKFPKHHEGVYVMDTEEKRIKALKWLKVEDIWGIGRQHSKKLRSYGINNAYQLSNHHDDWVRKEFSVVGLRLKRDLEGKETLGLEEPKKKKNIACTRSFDRTISELGEIEERVSTYAAICSEKLRKQNSDCKAILVFAMTNRFRKQDKQYYNSITVQIPFQSNSAITLVKYAKIALKKIYKKGYSYKKAGVVVLDITESNPKQIDLFQNENPKHINLMKSIDKINKNLGVTKVKLASQDIGRTWKMKQEHLSQRYTTNWDELLKVK